MDIKKAMQLYELRAYLEEKRAEQEVIEERYNHYHDPTNGRFASGKGGGYGLYYSMGKGRGEVVGAASDLVPDAVKQKAKKFAKHFGFDENNVTVQKNADGNYEVTGTKTIHKDKMTFSTIGVGDVQAHDETKTLTYIFDKSGNKIGMKRKTEGSPFSLTPT